MQPIVTIAENLLGSRADDLRHKIPLQRFFPESENVVKETSAGQSLQGRKWEEALYDLNKNIGREISNDRVTPVNYLTSIVSTYF